MKSALFSNLGQEENNLVKAHAVVNAVHRSKNSYNYVVLVTYEHKFNVSCGGLIKTKWVWKTETRHRHETKFNQKKFDDDLAQAQLLFNEAERAIKNETQSN